MKRWLWYLATLVLVAVLGWMPFTGTDVAKLQPVELIRVSLDGNLIQVETDTGDFGSGSTLEAAFSDLKQSTAGQVFLETADYLLLPQEAEGLLAELADLLRPACSICLEVGETDLENVAAFLGAHEPGLTLQDYRAGERTLPKLVTWEGRMHLVS